MNKKYTIIITETLEKVVVVKAANPEAAILKVKQDYRDEIHVLDASHHTGTKFIIR